MKRIIDIDMDELIHNYETLGMSLADLSQHYGVSIKVIQRHFWNAGYQLRSKAEAERKRREKAGGFDPLNTESANISRALSFQLNPGPRQGPDELVLIDHLTALGIKPLIPQEAVGPYNCDIGVYPVALEVWRGNIHMRGHKLEGQPERIRYFMDRGWHMIYIHVSINPRSDNVITRDTARFLAKRVRILRMNPSCRPTYSVVRCTGHQLARGDYRDSEEDILQKLSNMPDFRGRHRRHH